jgi:predicted alpha/beta-fold hydrolase
MPPFEPLFRDPHLQTIAAHFWPREDVATDYPPERRLFRTEPDVQVLVVTQRPKISPIGEIVMVHGLESSGEAGYIQSLAAVALRAGFAAHRFHMRTCGDTGHLAHTLYHAGLTSDLLNVLRQMACERDCVTPVFLAGFSLGGNVVLKLAGELASQAGELITGVVATSTPLDLAACARRIGEPRNRIYEKRFVRRMQSRLREAGYNDCEIAGVNSVHDLDDRFTAPSFGFGDAANYYRTQSSIRYLPDIRVPTLLIQAEDDTFIPFQIFRAPEVHANPAIQLIVTRHGGHLGFIGRAPYRLWLDHAIMDWISARAVKSRTLESSKA